MNCILSFLLSAVALSSVAFADQSDSAMLKRANRGDAEAQRIMGKRLFYGLNGTPVKRKIAIKWFKMAAEQGDAQALCILGELYESGVNVKQDTERARTYYQKAAEAGSYKAKEKLAAAPFNQPQGHTESRDPRDDSQPSDNEGDEKASEEDGYRVLLRGDKGKKALPLPNGCIRLSGKCRFSDDQKSAVIIEDGRKFYVSAICCMEEETADIAEMQATEAVLVEIAKNWKAVAEYVQKYDFCSDPLKLCYINAAVKWGNDSFAKQLWVRDDHIQGLTNKYLFENAKVNETVKENIRKLQGMGN